MSEFLRCNCTRLNHPWRQFCGGCGSRLPSSCTACGFANSKNDSFCGGCGIKIEISTRNDNTIPLDILDDAILSERST